MRYIEKEKKLEPSLPSVNLILDSDEPFSKLTNFYLSKKGSSTINTILSSIDTIEKRKRVGTITAPPGSGKSYLALFISALLSNKPDWNLQLEEILARQNKTYAKEIQTQMAQRKEKFLPVFILGEVENLYKTILASILLAIEKNGESISQFYSSKNIKLKEIDKKKIYIQKLVNKENFKTEYFSLLDYISTLGYSGILIFHDEFNRFLIAGNKNFNEDLNFLQDFAETNLRLKKVIVLHYLLLHKGISQYLNELSIDKKKEWLKIEGRFFQIAFQEELADTYGLISKSIPKISIPEKIKKEISESINQAWKINSHLETEIGSELKEISFNSYPIHLSSLLALPFLSQMFGQNERTLSEFLEKVNQKHFLYLDVLFDSFDSSIDKLGLDDSLLKAWLHGRSALTESKSKLEQRVIKVLTILTIIKNPSLLPGSAVWIAYSIGEDRKIIEAILKNLVLKRLAIFRESTKTFQIHYSSSVNFAEKVEENKASNQEVALLLNSSFALSPIYTHQFNNENFTSRFYSRKFLVEEALIDTLKIQFSEAGLEFNFQSPMLNDFIKNIFDDIYTKEKRSGSYGILFYFLGKKDSEIFKKLKTIISEYSQNKFFLILPNQNFKEIQLLKKIYLAEKLMNDIGFINQDPQLKNDGMIYLNDLREKIEPVFKNIFLKSNSEFIPASYNPEVSFNQYFSNCLSIRFPKSPKINSEFINRELLSPVIRNARKKIIREMLEGRELSTKESGYGPEVAIYRSIFTAKNIHLQNNYSVQLAKDFLGNEDIGIKDVFSEIHKFLNSEEKKSLDQLYEILTSEPYGIYSETIPFYLTACLIEKSYSFSIYEEDRYEKEINSDLVERIHLHPKNFKIKILKSNFLIEKYLNEISTIFTPTGITKFEKFETIDRDKIKENKVYKALISILYWFTKLTEYTRNNKNLDKQKQDFIEMLTNSTNPETLLLEDLPNLFSINLDTLDEKKLKNFLDKIQKLKSDIDLIYQNLLEQIISTCTKQINSYTNSNSKDLFTSIGELEAKESAKLEILQKQDKEFQRLLERFRFQYNSPEILAESIASIVCDAHPKYWKDHTLGEFSFKLTATLSKLHIANLMLNPSEGHTVKINRIVEEYKTLNKAQRLTLRSELEKVE